MAGGLAFWPLMSFLNFSWGNNIANTWLVILKVPIINYILCWWAGIGWRTGILPIDAIYEF